MRPESRTQKAPCMLHPLYGVRSVAVADSRRPCKLNHHIVSPVAKLPSALFGHHGQVNTTSFGSSHIHRPFFHIADKASDSAIYIEKKAIRRKAKKKHTMIIRKFLPRPLLSSRARRDTHIHHANSSLKAHVHSVNRLLPYFTYLIRATTRCHPNIRNILHDSPPRLSTNSLPCSVYSFPNQALDRVERVERATGFVVATFLPFFANAWTLGREALARLSFVGFCPRRRFTSASPLGFAVSTVSLDLAGRPRVRGGFCSLAMAAGFTPAGLPRRP